LKNYLALASFSVLVFVISILIPEAYADTIAWTGSGDGINWSDPANWNTNAIPSSGDRITIPSGTVHLNINFTTTSRITIQSSGTLVINSGQTLKNNGNVTNSGIIADNSDGHVYNTGGIDNEVSLTNLGTISVNSEGNVYNNGTIANSGNMIFNSGTFNNHRTFTNSGNIVFPTSISSTITLFSLETAHVNLASNTTIQNTGKLQFLDTPFNIPSGTVLTNHGTFHVSDTFNNTGTIINTGNMTADHATTINNNGGTIINNNGGFIYADFTTLNNNARGAISNNYGGTIYGCDNEINNNGGTINNSGGTMNNFDPIFGCLSPSGSIYNNSGAIINSGTIINHILGELYNNVGSKINNTGIINNLSFGNGFLSTGIVNNGIMHIFGNIIDNGTFANNGTIYNDACYNPFSGNPVTGKSFINTCTIPTAPLNVTAISVPPTSIVILWSISPNAQFYIVYRSNLSSGPFTTSVATQYVTSFTDVNVSPGTQYYYKISAVYAAGKSPLSSLSTATTSTAAPTGISATTLNSTAIKISWTGTHGATSYSVYRSSSQSGPFTTQVGTSSATSFINTGLNPNTKYYYKISATNSGGTSILSTIISSTTLLSAPSVTATSTSIHSIHLSWTASPGTTSYKIFRSTSSTSRFANAFATTTSTSFDDTGLATGIPYYYKIMALNSINTSDLSSIVSATPH
jgi:fibronectin type 3 domain-containing protein